MPLWKAILAVVLGVVVAAAASWPDSPRPSARAEAPCCCGGDACCCDESVAPEDENARCVCSCNGSVPISPQSPRPTTTPVSFWLLPLPTPDRGVDPLRPEAAPPITPPRAPEGAVLAVRERLALLGVRTT